MSLEEQEKELMEEIEDRGMKRYIRHEQFDQPLDMTLFDTKFEETKAITLIMILDEEMEDKDFIVDDFIHVAGDNEIEYFVENHGDEMERFDMAICSKDDQFSRQRGRVIATGRALKEDERHPILPTPCHSKDGHSLSLT